MKLIVLLMLCAPLVQAQGRGPNAEAAANLPAQAMRPHDLPLLQIYGLAEASRRAEPPVTITVAEYASGPIRVAGAVKEPLTFQARGPVTLLEAIARAGGLTPVAGSEILVSKTQTGPGGQRVCDLKVMKWLVSFFVS